LAQWNPLIDEIRPIVQEFVHRKTARTVREHDLPVAFVDSVRWDILHLCAEAEFTDVFPAGFYASQAHWYVKGHFPCGWRGDFPQGSLVLF
jgi:hypothetical protein